MFTVSTSFNLDRTRIERMLRLPGGMGRTIRAQIRRGSGGDFQGVISVNHPAALWVTGGTRPHRIQPRRPGGVLRFTAGGQVVYARYVNHPGSKANRFLQESLRAAL